MTTNNLAESAHDLVGQWKVSIKGPTGPMSTTLDLSFNDGVLSGIQSGQGTSSEIEDVEFSGGKISWVNRVTKPMKMKASFAGEFDGSTIAGKVKAGFMGTFPFEATRPQKASASAEGIQAAEDLDLATLPIEEQAFSADPLPYFASAKEKHPFLARCSFGYVVTQHEAMKDLMIMDDKMRPAQEAIVQVMGAEGTPWGRLASNVLLAKTGDTHKRLRSILTPLFTPRQANQNRELMKETAIQLLDEWTPPGAFDFEEFVSYYPIGVMCAMLGAPREALPSLRSSMETLGLCMSMDPSILPALQDATNVIDEFGQQLVADRRAGQRPEKGGELLDILIKANDEGGLSDRELYDLLIFLFIGGYDTSKNVLTLLMYEMLNYPEIYQRCAEDIAYCGKVVEESMRYHGVADIPRFTTEAIQYKGVEIPADCMMFFPANISGRDPLSFEDADVFDPERVHKNRHMGFGRGMHICLGQFIARAQMEVGLHEFAKRIRNPRPTTDQLTWRPFYGVWGLEGLPIEFEQGVS